VFARLPLRISVAAFAGGNAALAVNNLRGSVAMRVAVLAVYAGGVVILYRLQ
jgi:hypothetical protein